MAREHARRARWTRPGLIAATVVAIGVVVALLVTGDDSRPPTTTKRAQDFLSDVGCLSTTTTRDAVASIPREVPRALTASATGVTTVVCHNLGGFVMVLGYASPSERADAFAHRPARHRGSYCTSRDDIVITEFLLAGPPQASRTCPLLVTTR